jgi:hypothetical protein
MKTTLILKPVLFIQAFLQLVIMVLVFGNQSIIRN